MKQTLRKALTVLVLMALVLTANLAMESGVAKAVGSYGMAIVDSVNVRKQPSTTSEAWFRIDTGYVCQVLGTRESANETWYKVVCTKPNSSTSNTYTGYVLARSFRLMTDEECAAWEKSHGQTSGSSATATAYPSNVATGELVSSQVNVREGPSLSSNSMFKLDRGVVVELLSIPAAGDSDPWYRVRYNGYTGYIQGPYIKVLSTGNIGTTNAPSATATTTPGTTLIGYVKTTISNVNIRVSPGGSHVAQVATKGTILPCYGTMASNNVIWYYVVYGDVVGYVTDEYADPCDVNGNPSDALMTIAPATMTPNTTSAATPSPTAAPTPSPTVPQTVTAGYVKTTSSKVNVREEAGKSGTVIYQVAAKNTVMPYSATQVIGSVTWYRVTVNGITGWMHGSYLTLCGADGGAPGVTPAPTPTATATVPAAATATATVNVTTAPTPTATVQVTQAPSGNYGYVITTKGGVNLRDKPQGSSLTQIKRGVVLPLTGPMVPRKTAASYNSSYDWYPVITADGRTGYVRSDCVRLCDAGGNTVTAAPTSPAQTQTPAPTATGTPNVTPGPGSTTTPVLSTYGYAQTLVNSVKLRNAINGSTLLLLPKGTVVPLTGNPVTPAGSKYTWYPVRYGSYNGYLRGDCSAKLTPEQEAAYLAGQQIPSATATPVPVASSYVITTVNEVNLRVSASKDATSRTKVNAGTVFAYDTTTTVSGTSWYRVVYNNEQLWVLATSVRVMTQAEYEQYIAANPNNTPQAEVVLGYIKTTKDGVNVRATASSSASILGRVDSGMVYSYSEAVTSGSYTYYRVRTAVGVGYLRSDVVSFCDSNGNIIVTPSTTPGATTPITYTNLKLGSSGQAVTNLVTELKNQGYYTGDITSNYTSAVRAAVMAFQKDKGLTVDGIAGQKTQEALYGTSGNGGSSAGGSMVIYPAEKIDWFTGGIQELWAKGASYQVYDVYTGIVWTARRWSGGFHADVEPLTAADTAKLCQIYGVEKASDIAKNNLWQRRPCLVTIGTRTFACSLYGMPHNYPEGDTIPDNGMDGQVCIHFTNSKTHTGNSVDSYHQQAIEYAYQNAPNGHK